MTKSRSIRSKVIDRSEFDSDLDLLSVSQLIPKCKDGNHDARADLLDQMQGFLQLVAGQNMDPALQQKLGTSDIVQLSFLRVVEHFEQFRGKTAIEFRGWLKKIVVNEINKTRRSFSAEKRDLSREKALSAETAGNDIWEPADDQLTPSSQAVSDERIERFYKILNELSPDHAEVIRLRNIERLSFKKIGQRMQRSEDTSQKLWCRAMTKFEERLHSSGNFDSLS